MNTKKFLINEHSPPNKIWENRILNEETKRNLQATKDAVIVFDLHGKVIFLNESAIKYFPCPLSQTIGKPIGKLIPLNTIAQKRLFCKAMKYFFLASTGIPQQFHWVEEKGKHPIRAFNLIFNATVLNDEKVIITRFIDILQVKTFEWALWSLAKITNYGCINEVIDDITELASEVFRAEYAVVNLFDQETTHSISYFYQGKKEPNFTHALANTPCAQVRKEKKICHYNGNVRTKFPETQLFTDFNITSYLGGPLINSEDEVVGALVVMSARKFEVDSIYKTLFQLFIDRISLEIERLLAQRKLQFLASIPQQDPNPVIRIHSDGTFLYANQSGLEILHQWSMRNNKIPNELLKVCQRAQEQRKVIREEFTINHRIYLFTLVWIESFSQINIYAIDISELKWAQQKMRDLANFDTLTNVANREHFKRTFNHWLIDAKNNNEPLALLLIDLDNFKSVNDTFGHPIGDRLLKTVTRRISGCLRSSDFIARLGGDEFVVLLKIHQSYDIFKIAKKINQVLSSPFELGEYHIESSCSTGISFYPQDGVTTSELLKNADIAMYQAKKNGRNQFCLFSNVKHSSESKRRTIIKRSLKSADLATQLSINYQPQFDLQSKKIIGFEAFVRWYHPKEGLISPYEFIPLAEQTGAIYSIGYWVIQQALQDYQKTMQLVSDAKLSLNIALSQLNDHHFIEYLCENIHRFEVSNELIVLDLAEQISTIQYRHLDEHLQEIHKLGIQLSLDNYGSEHSSISRLLEVPINVVKIDQNFLHTLETQPRHRAFISGIIDLANKMELQVIQKGVESKSQNEVLKNLGCRYAQGFYYCPPLSLSQLKEFLTKYAILN
ncbi:GGDEF domain-containing sensory box protein [Legionella nautarum]|uniref:GGDEF domain-containing sensory box protein n=1 Tax=Legionella nautarum TaxID=45070 RepID=A0A0W0WKE7_9GAMM|nr:EAL domain-containing protein [Legionella nautarum]KTD32805.1 GGDEF domain-containing sensory box protein [Legionella nautarum]